jgi:arylsulfatase A-like enzyme
MHYKLKRFIGQVSLLLILFVSCVSAQQPNILLINIDDMGWKDVGFMGSHYYETPNLDELAAEGMIFSSAYAQASNCAPSRACLMSGQWTPRHGIYTVDNSDRGESPYRKLIPTPNTTVLGDKFITMAEVFQQAGYITCHAGKWHLGDNPKTQGFDLSIGGSKAGHPGSYYPPYGLVGLEAPNGEYLTDLIMSRVADFVNSLNGDPFFLYYSPYAVHTPIHPIDSLMPKYLDKPGHKGQSDPRYATMIDNLDRNIGNLIEVLKERDLYHSTLILFTSDNGGHFSVTRQQPLRAGKGSYYEGGIREPFFAVWPGRISAGTHSDLPVCQLDIYPTLLEASGLETPSGYQLDGKSILPTLEGDPQKELNMRPLFWHFPIYLQAGLGQGIECRDTLFRTRPGSVIRVGNWKMHHYFEDDGIELYKLNKDIGERKDLAKKRKRKAEELLGILNRWREETGAPVPVELNPEFIPRP